LILLACFFCSYNPAVTLSGENNEQFRGLLVQGRQSVGMAPVGTFTGFTSNTKPSNCTPYEVCVAKPPTRTVPLQSPPVLLTYSKSIRGQGEMRVIKGYQVQYV